MDPPFKGQPKDQDRCPLNRGVHSIDVIDKKIIWTCFWGSRGNNVWLEWWCPLKKGIPKERFYCKMTTKQKVLPENANLPLLLLSWLKHCPSTAGSWVLLHGFPLMESPSSLFFPGLSEAPGKLGNFWNLIFLTWRTISKRCSFGGRNHWFRMDGMPIRVKNMRFKKYPDSSGPGPSLHVAYITEMIFHVF